MTTIIVILLAVGLTLQLITIMKVSELQPALDAVNATLQKVQGEVTNQAAALNQRISELEAIINGSSDPDLPAAAADSLAALKASADAIDALNPDAPAAPQ